MFIQEGIFINGIPIDEICEGYTANTGYVLQLATPYYEELTVGENLFLAAQMKLPSSMEWKKKFERVKQVMEVVCSFIFMTNIPSCTSVFSIILLFQGPYSFKMICMG